MFKYRKYNPKSWRNLFNRLDVNINLNICQGYMFVGIRISALYLQDKIIIVNNEGKNYVYKRIDLFTSDLEYKLRKYRVSRYPYELFIKEDKFIVNRRGLNGLHSKNRL